MARLNQILAIEKGIKSNAYAKVTTLHKAVQKAELFDGLAREYEKRDDAGDDLPSERKAVQFNVPNVLSQVESFMTDLITIVARKDWTNTVAKADVEIDGVVLMKDVPATHLLFLEKQLSDLKDVIAKLPTLDEAEVWLKDENSNLFRSEPVKRQRTQKVETPVVLYPATPEHPAQTHIATTDVIVGFWSTTKFSGAIPKPERDKLERRVEALSNAVKQAREAANGANEVAAAPVAKALFDYVLGR